jgi:hypothetical protein
MEKKQGQGGSTTEPTPVGGKQATFTPLKDPITKLDMIIRNPAPNASTPAVSSARVISTS